jgi:hypothetical protein
MPSSVQAFTREQDFARGLQQGLGRYWPVLKVKQDGEDLVLSLGRRSTRTGGLLLVICADAKDYGEQIGKGLRGNA